MLRVAAEKQWGAFQLERPIRTADPGRGRAVRSLRLRQEHDRSTSSPACVEADRGEVTLDETVLLDTRRNIHVAAERRRIGYVFQDARLFPHLSVAANLRYAQKRAIGTPYVSSMQAVTRMLGLAPLMQRRTHQLSGGERQRVAIGRALLTPAAAAVARRAAGLARPRTARGSCCRTSNRCAISWRFPWSTSATTSMRYCASPRTSC